MLPTALSDLTKSNRLVRLCLELDTAVVTCVSSPVELSITDEAGP